MTGSRDEARDYVYRAMVAGHSPEAIRQALSSAGWSTPQIARALDAWAPGRNGLPIPRPPTQISARDTFLHLILFAALYVSAWQLGALAFDLIELALPDPAERPGSQEWRHQSIRFSVAALIVAFPIFLAMTAKLDREIAADPVRRESPVRQWLGYLTLFGAVVVLAGSAVSLLYGLLRGDLTVQFLVKVAVVAGIAGGLFGWFRIQLQARRPRPGASSG